MSTDPRVMSEDDLQTCVMDLARAYGLLVHHCRPARTLNGWATPISGTKGFPDLVISGKRGVLFRELKSTKGRSSAEQTAWLETLTAGGADAALWRPEDWPLRVLRELQAVR